MKRLSLFIVLAVIMLAVVLCGCHSTTTIMEFDKDGKLVKKTESSESPILSIEKSLKNKAVITWYDGLRMSGSISPGTTDEPTPHVEGKFENGNGGFATFPKEMPPDSIKAIAVVVKTTKTDALMGITSDGVSIRGQSKATETDSATNSTDTEETAAASEAKE